MASQQVPPEVLREIEYFNREFPVGAEVDVLTDAGEIKRTIVAEPAFASGVHYADARAVAKGVAYPLELERFTKAKPPPPPPAGRQPPPPPADVPGQLTLFNVEQSALGGGR